MPRSSGTIVPETVRGTSSPVGGNSTNTTSSGLRAGDGDTCGSVIGGVPRATPPR
ncbi:hypothetical protein [Saccharothrix sp. ALI-22-I]|uniref:hypothetical protein n=1 Tax=Saccharothrix sp. ALI-22-I TaxID=1933778 RepID=UPI0015C3B046|nr:hypothetical protein [Saccharothrix sp. ALI-22-I]